MKSVSSWIWTRVALSISYDDNHYTTGTSVWFYGISAIVGYLKANPVYTYILNISDLVCLGIMTYLLHSRNTYTTIYRCMRKHSQHNNDERTHFFRKIYLSHFIRNVCERVEKGLCVRGELETEQTATYSPPTSSFVFSSTSFSFCWAAQSGVLRAHSTLLGAGSLYSILSPTNWLQTNWTSCRTGLYHCLTSTCFLWASHLHPIQPIHSQGYTLISSIGCTCSLIDRLVGGQYVTNRCRLFNVKPSLYICIY